MAGLRLMELDGMKRRGKNAWLRQIAPHYRPHVAVGSLCVDVEPFPPDVFPLMAAQTAP